MYLEFIYDPQRDDIISSNVEVRLNGLINNGHWPSKPYEGEIFERIKKTAGEFLKNFDSSEINSIVLKALSWSCRGKITGSNSEIEWEDVRHVTEDEKW